MPAAPTQTDILVIGAGHNGLTTAAYLLAGGLSVTVVEARSVIGGATLTEEFHPGFRNSVCSYSVSVLHPKVIADLELHRHGLEIMERSSAGFVPLPGGDALFLARDMAAAKAELERFAPGDGAAYESFSEELARGAKVLRRFLLDPPPNLGGGPADLWRLLKAAGRMGRLSTADQALMAELFTSSAGDFLDKRLNGAPVKGLYGYAGVVGSLTSPYAPGSAYVLLHHSFGEVNGKVGAWGHARGGMGAIAQAMAAAVGERGGTIRTDSPVREILTDKGRASGVVLVDGTVLKAGAVVAAINPQPLFLDMVDPALLPADFRRHMGGYRNRSGTFRMNVALGELPDFTARPGTAQAEHHTASVVISPSLRYLEDAYDNAKHGGWAKRPVIEMNIPSTIDDSLAPPGRHVASLFCQHFHPDLSEGRDWDDVKEQVADLILDTVTEYAPNFRNAVIGRQVLSPKDLERDFGLTGGDIFHGQLDLDQLFSLRPAPGYADHRTPLPGLYLAGSGTHPGGGVSGLPGHNAARVILKDLKRRRA
ncbi:phytoene desaturase family protein [Roseospirillum parvum]|uniref:Pyridine nucleotide-disulfide oxidoreductase domain-containing protein 2 n=1 Tax=Roseospirillum parvum TaxID=83401 RepID=A0A1G7V6K8_9PROT|nr:NAD(P)/FAD-dependent oxidoreductase [Roseospirillum parvum]SDG55442.1 Phytoene dehydrogenase-related protein [Roseospirillum parvum]